MAYTIMDTSYMCRADQSVRLYHRPNDIKPAAVVFPAGTDFTTDGEITIGTVTFLRIDEILGSNTDHASMKGMWIPTDTLQMIPISTEVKEPEETTFDDSKATDESLLIVGSNVLIYDKSDSSTPIAGTLEIGDLITTDRVINVVINGLQQTRYRIASVKSEDGTLKNELIGNWILLNYAITVNEEKYYFQNQKVRAVAANVRVTATGFSNTTVNTPKNDITITQRSQSQTRNSYQTVNRTAQTDSQAAALAANDDEMDALYQEYGFSYGTAATTMSTPIGRLMFVHGMPFQYTYLTDRRAYSTARYGMSSYPTTRAIKNGTADFYGRTFGKEIAANMPIAVVVPGVPTFLTTVRQSLFGSNGNSKKKLVNDWVSLWSDLTDTEQAGVLRNLNEDANSDNVYQYYSLRIDTTSYYQHVNALTKTSARLMGLDNVKYMGKACTEFDWGDFNQAADQDYSMFMEVMGADGGVSFAYDPLSSITDSISNSTGESQFAGLLNGISSKARELDFMTGSAGVDISMVDQTDYDTATAQLNSGLFSGITNPLSHLKTFIQNAGHGMNVRFPQIWNDSNSSKSYSIDMKFIAPYATAFCKWRYVLVPFFHWFALAAPHSDDSLVNYSRPYLIKAFSKGYFNVEMGIITSLQWKRFGDGDMISADGIPTEIDVTVDFEDLYQQIAISTFSGSLSGDMKRVGIFFNNTGLMDLLGTLSGVNMNKMSISDRIELYTSAWTNAVAGTGTNFMRHMSDRLANIANNVLLGT